MAAKLPLKYSLSKSYRPVKIEIWKCDACLTEKSYIASMLKVKKLSSL